MQRIIADKGKGYYHIAMSKMPHEAEIYASSTLFQYLYKSTSAIVPLYSDVERCPKRTPEIYIGASVREMNIDTSALSQDGFVVRTIGEDIVIAGGSPRGTVYGVYWFLEKYIGFKCFTKDTETYNKVETLVVEDLDVTVEPAFEYREMYLRPAFDTDFCVKNRLNSNMTHIPREKGGKLKFFNFHHSFNELVPPEIHFKSHPEYYSLVNGERLGERTQLCLSNEGVFSEARKTLRRWIKENPDCKVFSVAQNDWYNYCTCENCRRLDEQYGTPAASMITFVNRLADDIKEDYPDVFIHTFAYQYTKRAPKGMKVRDNVIVRLCNIECSWETSMEEQAKSKPDSEAASFIENIKDWSAICKHLYIWDYTSNFRNYLMPFPNYFSLSENMKTYYKSGITGVMQQGNFSYGELSGLMDLTCYVGAKLLWDPKEDISELINDFINGVYGSKSAPYIREYVDLLCDSIKGNELSIYQNSDAPYITDELINKADELFKMAIDNAETEKNKWYLEKEYLSVLFMKASRLPLDDPERNKLIDELYNKVKAFGISEIRERTHLDISFDILRKSRYAVSKEGEYSLYYIMK